MFGNRAISVQLTKPPKPRKDASLDSPDVPSVDLDKISNLVLDHTKNVAKIAGGAYVAKRLLDTACEIAVIVAKAKLK